MSPLNCNMKMSPLAIIGGTEGRCSDEKRSDVHDGRSETVRRGSGAIGRQDDERKA